VRALSGSDEVLGRVGTSSTEIVKEFESARHRKELGGPVWRWRGGDQSAFVNERTANMKEKGLKGRGSMLCLFSFSRESVLGVKEGRKLGSASFYVMIAYGITEVIRVASMIAAKITQKKEKNR
jgi:hypothetical protein